MQKHKTSFWDDSEEVAELFELEFQPNVLDCFFKAEASIHHFFSELSGYTGMEVMLLSDTKVILLLRWQNCDQFDEHLPVILNASPIGNWLTQASTYSHRPVIVKKFCNH